MPAWLTNLFNPASPEVGLVKEDWVSIGRHALQALVPTAILVVGKLTEMIPDNVMWGGIAALAAKAAIEFLGKFATKKPE